MSEKSKHKAVRSIITNGAENMSFFPIFTELNGQSVLVCGGAKHAQEKIERLMPFGAKIFVVSKEISPEILDIEGITVEQHAFSQEDMEKDPVFVVAAESDEENLRIRKICHENHVWVNAVDQPQACDFIFPSLISRGDLTIGISTGGTSPTAAVMLRRQIESMLPEKTAAILASMPETRRILKMNTENNAQLKAALHKAVELAFSEDRPLSEQEILLCAQEEKHVL